MSFSLELFLTAHQLDQYYQSFINAGATDHDLPHLLALNDQELNEMIHAVQMLPFHSIKFKKALREQRAPESSKISASSSSSSPSSLSSSSNKPSHISSPGRATEMTCHQAQGEEGDTQQRATIASHAVIYGKNSARPLTNYELSINRASIEFALQDPSLLINKGRLFDLAKKKLLEQGYQYKRGKSRSKFLSGVSNVCEEDPVTWLPMATPTSPPLSPTLSLDERKRIKRKEHAARQSMERRLRIDRLEAELVKLRSSGSSLAGGLVKMIGKLKAQERKHQWYKRKTQEKSSVVEPLPSPPHMLLSPPSFTDFHFRPLSVSPPPSEPRVKVLTVRDCCNT